MGYSTRSSKLQPPRCLHSEFSEFSLTHVSEAERPRCTYGNGPLTEREIKWKEFCEWAEVEEKEMEARTHGVLNIDSGVARQGFSHLFIDYYTQPQIGYTNKPA